MLRTRRLASASASWSRACALRTPSPDPGETLRAAVVGSGLLGSRRALDLLSLEKTSVAAIVGPAEEQGRALARRLQEIQRQPCDWLPDFSPLLDAQPLDL